MEDEIVYGVYRRLKHCNSCNWATDSFQTSVCQKCGSGMNEAIGRILYKYRGINRNFLSWERVKSKIQENNVNTQIPECKQSKNDNDIENALSAINKLCIKYNEGINCDETGMRILYRLAKEAQQYLTN